ncbi:MAG: alpha/beta fold hydrolase [Gammaproteobacteria bacterium]|nr:alpha/beta fold hydrolase [Gammaproteobacteria bacterium]
MPPRPAWEAGRPEALDTRRAEIRSPRAGRIAYYADEGPAGHPLVLLHSINAAPSAFEMRPLFDHYRGRRPVFAPELPGYGHSERSRRPYSPELYAGAIENFMTTVVKGPADVVAFSLSAEFAAAD